MENLEYMPIFRARQQEIIVLNEFDFGNKIFPMIEIIKEKDRKNNTRSSFEIYSHIVENTSSDYIFLELPVYIHLTTSTNEEVVSFTKSVIERIEERLNFLKQFRGMKKVIPVISGLTQKTGETNTILAQFDVLKDDFPILAFRIYHNSFETDKAEVRNCLRNGNDILIYDLDNIAITSPVFRIQKPEVTRINASKKVLVRSAIGKEIQNVRLEHEKVVAEADNSLIELYKASRFDTFGDYVGIKKDDLSSGGQISPGLIFFDPTNNLYYGYKGAIKRLEEFENTIVPAVLRSAYMNNLKTNNPEYIDKNEAISIMQRIISGDEPGKSQAKFKKIAMLHYLHCMKTAIESNHQLPLS